MILFFDKVTQAGLNQLPFFTALLFLDKDYLNYYKILTLLYLFNTLGTLGLERTFANNNINLIKTGKRIFKAKILMTIAFVIWSIYFINLPPLELLFSSAIVLINVSTFGEFLYVGGHIKKPLIITKLIIVILGIILRFLFRDITFYIVLLFLESLIYLIAMLKLIKSNDQEKEISIDNIQYLYSTAFMLITFLVTKLYVFGLNSSSQINIKFIHYFDYLPFISSFLGSLILKKYPGFQLSDINNKIFISSLILFLTAILFHTNNAYYISAKILSALNVFVVYIFFAKLDIKSALILNLPSLIIMLIFISLSYLYHLNIFQFMLTAEFSVGLFLILKHKQKWFFS